MPYLQAPHTLLLIRPASFGFNEQTASTNFFQKGSSESAASINHRALVEFDAMVDKLRDNEVDVLVFDDSAQPEKPDAIFPNNWLSLHEDGKLVLYPMLAHNRRLERRPEIVQLFNEKFLISEVIDFSQEENQNRIVEGTGSLVFDHVHKIAYASRSERTHQELVVQLCRRMGYQPIVFDAVDEAGKPIYHTNVLLCVGEKFAVLCLDAVRNESDQELLLTSFHTTQHKVIAISYAQMRSFAGNMLEVKNTKDEPVVLLSQTAFNSLLPGQVDAITRFADMLPINITTIEAIGGGSVRCMVVGIHTPKKQGKSLSVLQG
jgi:hypothetical protein